MENDVSDNNRGLEIKLQEVRSYIENFVESNESDFCLLVSTPDEIMDRLQDMIFKKDTLCKFIFACGNQEAHTVQYSSKRETFKMCTYYILQGEPEVLKII